MKSVTLERTNWPLWSMGKVWLKVLMLSVTNVSPVVSTVLVKMWGRHKGKSLNLRVLLNLPGYVSCHYPPQWILNMFGQCFFILGMDESFSLSQSYEFDTGKKYHLILFSRSGDSNQSLQWQISISLALSLKRFSILCCLFRNFTAPGPPVFRNARREKWILKLRQTSTKLSDIIGIPMELF